MWILYTYLNLIKYFNPFLFFLAEILLLWLDVILEIVIF